MHGWHAICYNGKRKALTVLFNWLMCLPGKIAIIFSQQTTAKSMTMKLIDHVYSDKTEYHSAACYNMNLPVEQTVNRTDCTERPANLKDADESSKVLWETADEKIGS